MTTPSNDLPIREPLTGFVGDIGGVPGDEQGIFRTSDRRITTDLILSLLTRGSAVIVLSMLAVLIFVLLRSSMPSIRQFGISFFTQTTWQPNQREIHTRKRDAKGNLIVKSREVDPFTAEEVVTYDETVEVFPPSFGALSAIYGTVVSAALALVIAVPLSFGAALFLVRVGAWLSPSIVKCGVAGLLLTMLFAGMGRGSSVYLILGACLGLAATGAILFVAWQNEDPRVGPRPAIEIGVALLIAITVFAFGAGVLRISMPASIIAAMLAAVLVHLLAASFVGVVSFLIEFLAAIPSIAYGIWGTLVLAPFMRDHVAPSINADGHNMLSGALILAIMILPIITAISRDVLKAVPRIQIEGTQALGATWWQSSWAMLQYGRTGLFGAVVLGLARAAGETMAIVMIMPPETRINFSVFKPVATMSALIASQFPDANQEIQRSALTEMALLLLLMSLMFNIVARYLVVGARRTAA
jgi:phosphate transport system permease protein